MRWGQKSEDSTSELSCTYPGLPMENVPECWCGPPRGTGIYAPPSDDVKEFQNPETGFPFKIKRAISSAHRVVLVQSWADHPPSTSVSWERPAHYARLRGTATGPDPGWPAAVGLEPQGAPVLEAEGDSCAHQWQWLPASHLTRM